MSFEVDAVTKQKIINSAYYHLKHYEDFGGNKPQSWIQTMHQTIDQAENSLKSIIEIQKKKEQELLDAMFAGATPKIEDMIKLGFLAQDAKTFINDYSIGKSGANIDIRIQALNRLIEKPLTSFNKEDRPLEKAIKIIEKAFQDNITEVPQNFTSLEGEEVFISTLVAVARSLDVEIKKEDLLADVLSAPLRKLNSAINFYIKDYKNRLKKENMALDSLNKIFDNFSPILKEYKTKSWGKKYQSITDFNSVEAVLRRSADGFLKATGGQRYEKIAADRLMEGLEQVFKTTNVEIDGKGSKITGLKTDALTKRQQKGDIELHFDLFSSEISPIDFNVSFSVKKKENGDFIQIHHGGSLFAYANRLSNTDIDVDFSFLNEGNFQYVYVNELAKSKGDFESGNAFLKAFRELIKGFGWVFLGQEISEKVQGADFLYIQGKIYSFSSILEKIRLNPSAYLQAIISQTKRDPMDQKHSLLNKYPLDKFAPYNEGFINDSIKAGNTAIYGTTFSIYLKKVI